jgi:3-hydroxy-9,10-secoandrosta-1,3,5(10)-triene-9,17-dione monooxygenase reductase component
VIPVQSAGTEHRSPVDGRALRDVCGNFATGVTVITSGEKDEAAGTTVNSFTSVSLDPPLVLICLHHNSRLLPVVQHSGGFVVNFLTRQQQEVAWAFAGRDSARIEEVPHHRSEAGLPVLSEALAFLDCTLINEYDGGDHTILLGEVVELGAPAAAEDPLIFFQGAMRELDSELDSDADDAAAA